MNTCLPSPAWDRGPFADAMERALWELGYPGATFDTESEARAAVDHALSVWPELRRLSLRFEEV